MIVAWLTLLARQLGAYPTNFMRSNEIALVLSPLALLLPFLSKQLSRFAVPLIPNCPFLTWLTVTPDFFILLLDSKRS